MKDTWLGMQMIAAGVRLRTYLLAAEVLMDSARWFTDRAKAIHEKWESLL